jgi:hypothetical protein
MRCALLIVVALVALCRCSLAATPDEDVTAPASTVVPLKKPDQPIDMPAPPSQYNPGNGEDAWKAVWRRVVDPSVDHGGGNIDFSQMMGEGFRSAKDFVTERFTSSDSGSEMQISVSASEAGRREKKIYLKTMKMVVFINRGALTMTKPAENDDVQKKKDAKHHEGLKHADHNNSVTKRKDGAVTAESIDTAPKGKKSPKKAGSSMAEALQQSLFFGGRMVIEAPETVIDLASNEARATGNVTITIFPKYQLDKEEIPLAVLSSERLHWRTWNEASTGSSEMAIYTCSEKPGEPDPIVTGRYTVPQPDGTLAQMVITGRGMIFETGVFDLPKIVYDEDGRTAGLSKVARNRAIFHSDIRVETTATTMDALMPFQPTPEALAKRKKKEADGPLPKIQTTVVCAGPAVLDLAAVPRVKKTLGMEPVPLEPNAPVTAKEVSEMPMVSLARRLEFLNGVSMSKIELHEAASELPANNGRSEMTCRHLCMQYPAFDAPNASSYPEYAEAIGGVKMSGTNLMARSQESTAPTPAQDQPFKVVCQRIFFDGVNDNMFLVGSATKPVEVSSAELDASALQFNYRSLTGTFTMPAQGSKKLVIHAAALAAMTAA